MFRARHFSLEEFTLSQTAVRRGIPNDPTPEHLANLEALCANILDPLRDCIGRPIKITSGYRSPALNKAVKGSSTSQHCYGQAADIQVPGLSVDEVVAAIRQAKLPFDQLIHEFGSWTHVSYSGERCRGQCLCATKVAGKTKYANLA